jgi:hypothetical protein
MFEIEGAVAGFTTLAAGFVGFADVVADFTVSGAIIGFVAGFEGFAVGAPTGLATPGATGLVVGVADFAVAEIGTSGGTGACFLVTRASLSSKSIKIFLRSKLRSALGTRRT